MTTITGVVANAVTTDLGPISPFSAPSRVDLDRHYRPSAAAEASVSPSIR